MPVVRFHLPEGLYSTSQVQGLLAAASELYGEVLASPLSRIRALARLYPPELYLVGGEAVSAGAAAAPFFEFIVLTGRPLEQRQALHRRFTELCSDHLGCERELVRGRAVEVEPEDWSIGGEPASAQRSDEIAARAAAT